MFFDRPESGELAVLVHLSLSGSHESNHSGEFEELAVSAQVNPVVLVEGRRYKPDPTYFIGSGKLREVCDHVESYQADVVIFNHRLSPSQERNLEQQLQCRVLDRTGLILDIFAQRARTHEGKLQVELAQLEHISTRLVRGWTHLERQKGGIGLRGPGETQLETDRRLLRARIATIQSRLEKVRKQRQHGRRLRKRSSMPTISLVGYTNSGKSTLFNRLTRSNVYVKDQLFATLDPTMRRIQLKTAGPATLADTVGFISHLPHQLVEAFRATLEEASHSSLLLHVIDSASKERSHNIEQVEQVLAEIDAMSLPHIKVYNKLDLLPEQRPRIDRNETGQPVAVWLSAKTGEGVDLLLQALTERLAGEIVSGCLRMDQRSSRLRAKLYDLSAVKKENYTEDGSSKLSFALSKTIWERLLSTESINEQSLQWISSTPTLEDNRPDL
ncbi:MAG: GTP-binding protein HflX [Cellvibrionaceae bacterium]